MAFNKMFGGALMRNKDTVEVDAKALAGLVSTSTSQRGSRAPSEASTRVGGARGPVPVREVDYKSVAPRVGLRAGDVVAFVTPDEGFPYNVREVEDDSRGDVETKYKFACDVDAKGSAASLRERRETQLEVLQHNGFIGFRSAFARDRLLQATRQSRNRLVFASANFGTWEEWVLDAQEMQKLNDAAWMRCEVTLKHRRLDAYTLKVTLVRVGRIVGGGDGDGDDDEYRLGPSASRQSTPGGTVKALSAVDRWRLSREDQDDETPSKAPHAMHAMGGALMKEWAAALEKEVSARKLVEQELHELHEADDKLREWALNELNRLRAFAQKEVDSLASEVEERNKKMTDLKQQRRALELRSKMLESLDEERLQAVSRAFQRIQTGNLLKKAFAHWRRTTQGLSKMNNIELAFSKYHSKEYNKKLLSSVIKTWRRELAQSKRARRVYSSVLNRFKYVAFRTWANEMRNNALRRGVNDRIAPSGRIAAYLNGALSVGFQMRGERKQHQRKSTVVAYAQTLPGGVRTALVATAFDVGLECENAAMYKLTDALSDPVGAINLARQSALRNVADDTVMASEIAFAFDQGILVASRMIQLRYIHIWDNADTVQEAMALTAAFDTGEDQANIDPLARAKARQQLMQSLKSTPPSEAKVIRSAFYRGNYSRDFAEERKSRAHVPDAFTAGLEAGLCRYKRREIASQAASAEEYNAVVTAFDSGIALACLSVVATTDSRAELVLGSAEDGDRTTVAWMRETLLTTIEVAAGNIASSSSELVLHKIYHPLRMDMLRNTFKTWVKSHRDQKEEDLVASRFSARRERRLKKETLISWHNEVVAGKKRQLVLSRAVKKMRNIKLNHFFLTWYDNVAKCARDRAVLTRIVCRIQNRLLRSAFSKWAELSGKNERIDRLAAIMNGRMRHAVLAKAFSGWQSKVQDAALNRHRASSFLLRYTKSSLSKAFNTWAENAQENAIHRRKCEKVIVRARNRLASAAYFQWRDLVQDNRKRLNSLQRFVTRMRSRLMAKAFDQWYGMSRDGARRREMLHRTFSRIKNETLSRSFNSWHEATIERVETRMKLRKVVNRMLRLRLSQAITVWSENTTELIRQRVLIQKFVSRATKRAMVQCFYSWVDSIEQAKTASKALAYRDRLIANVISRTNRSTLRNAMAKWREVVEEREIHREMIRRNLRAKRVAMNFFMNWYWDAFDNDIQETMADMFGQTRTYMNEVFEDDRGALDFDGVDDDDEGAYSPPPPSFRDGGASRPPSEFHTPSKMRDDDDDDDDVDSIPVRLVRDIQGRSPAFHDDDDNEMFSDIQDAGGDAFID
jgi:protein SFI1